MCFGPKIIFPPLQFIQLAIWVFDILNYCKTELKRQGNGEQEQSLTYKDTKNIHHDDQLIFGLWHVVLAPRYIHKYAACFFLCCCIFIRSTRNGWSKKKPRKVFEPHRKTLPVLSSGSNLSAWPSRCCLQSFQVSASQATLLRSSSGRGCEREAVTARQFPQITKPAKLNIFSSSFHHRGVVTTYNNVFFFLHFILLLVVVLLHDMKYLCLNGLKLKYHLHLETQGFTFCL